MGAQVVWGMGHMGNGYRGYGPWGIWHSKVHKVQGVWAMETHGAIGYRVWGTVGISHMGNEAIGYRGYGVQRYW